MNPTFKTKYDQMRQNKPTEPETSSASAMNGDNYSEAGHVRNLCFVWPDGKMQFLNYSYLVLGEFLPETNSIVLEFTTHVIKIGGYHLQSLFDNIMQQIAMKIICTDTRYNALNAGNKPLINQIQVEKPRG